MAKSKTIRVSEEELALLQKIRNEAKATDGEAVVETAAGPSDSQQALADAFVSAIERTRDPKKRTVANRKKNTPWTPKDGSPKLKLKRKFFHHGIPVTERVSNEEIALMNRIKPGRYCDGVVQVLLRKDRGLDIDYPVKTNAQRLKMLNKFGVTSFTVLLERIVDEQTNPVKYRRPEDADLYE